MALRCRGLRDDLTGDAPRAMQACNLLRKKYFFLKRLYVHIAVGLSSVWALRRPLPPRSRGVSSACGSSKAFGRLRYGQNPLMFKRFHVVLFGKQHAI